MIIRYRANRADEHPDGNMVSYSDHVGAMEKLFVQGDELFEVTEALGTAVDRLLKAQVKLHRQGSSAEMSEYVKAVEETEKRLTAFRKATGA